MLSKGAEGKVLAIAKRELSTYFSSPIAFIFLGTFLAVTMFIFFWVETFFARNIADLKPLFKWMPILLVFLVSALTMKMWSEERRMGTIEFLLTAPVKTHQLVLGKFLACMGLVCIALLLTIGMPFTVGMLGQLDFGPVVGAYLASVLLAAAYVAIGLFLSSRTDNQIVSLMLTIVVCSVFYIIGADALTALVGNVWGEIFHLFGTGARFESITRGVIDFRDLYYYVSITAVFLALNVFSLERLKWSVGESSQHRVWRNWVILFVVNLIAANFWLQKITILRTDLTKGNIYSISPATEGFIEQLREPLLIRGYFSERTHPLLAPLVPQVRNLIREYEVVSQGKIQAEFVDPRENPEIEEEAAQKYNIKPIPFQVADKYQASLVNSYFDVLIKYGDKYEVLGFRDLIELKAQGEGGVDVQLRNPEYDLTRSIKKVLYGFQSLNTLFAELSQPVKFTGYLSQAAKLPQQMNTYTEVVQKILNELKDTSADKLEIAFVDPDAEGGKIAKEIGEQYGFRPMIAGLFDSTPFYYYMVLQSSERIIQVPLPEDLTEDGARRAITGALKRFSKGFMKTIGLVAPPPPPRNPYMQQMGMSKGKQFALLDDKLRQNHSVKNLMLDKGTVSEDIDMLMVAAPKELDSKQLFAVDQFLMKGGTVMIATSPFSIERGRQDLKVIKRKSGLRNWLTGYGIEMEDKLILDPQNEAYPVPVNRKLGNITIPGVQLVNYPHFVDVRGAGMSSTNMITSGVPQVTINWPSPLKIDAEKNKDRTVIELLRSSDKSWATPSTSIQPDFAVWPEYGFPEEAEKQAYLMAAVVEGTFESYFKGKKSPLIEEKSKEEPEDKKKEGEAKEEGKEGEKKESVVSGVIDKSSEAARIILVSSNEFLTDETLQISQVSGSGRFLNSLELIENSVDWSLEDRALLSIRSRGRFSRTLRPMRKADMTYWEVINYVLALLGLLIVFAVYRMHKTNLKSRYEAMLSA